VAAIGAMLPDLWRMADRRVRAVEALSARDDLERGVAHHLEVDRWFHATEVFLAGERDTRRALAALSAPKIGRFGHIAWELCLDGALLSARDFDAELAALRRDFARIDLEAMVALADRYGAETLDAGAQSRFQDRMRRIVEGLGEGSWIAGYQRGEGLARSLEGIRLRVGLGAFDAAARDELAETLERRLDAAHEALPRLFDERREQRGPS
jgi:hypothetical protein